MLHRQLQQMAAIGYASSCVNSTVNPVSDARWSGLLTSIRLSKSQCTKSWPAGTFWEPVTIHH